VRVAGSVQALVDPIVRQEPEGLVVSAEVHQDPRDLLRRYCPLIFALQVLVNSGGLPVATKRFVHVTASFVDLSDAHRHGGNVSSVAALDEFRKRLFLIDPEGFVQLALRADDASDIRKHQRSVQRITEALVDREDLFPVDPKRLLQLSILASHLGDATQDDRPTPNIPEPLQLLEQGEVGLDGLVSLLLKQEPIGDLRQDRDPVLGIAEPLKHGQHLLSANPERLGDLPADVQDPGDLVQRVRLLARGLKLLERRQAHLTHQLKSAVVHA